MKSDNKDLEEDFLQQEAPLLAGLSKEDPYLTPENYFEELQREIGKQCLIAVPGRSGSGFRFTGLQLALAAATVLIMIACKEN